MLDTEYSRNNSYGENRVVDDSLFGGDSFAKISLVGKNREKELESNPSNGSY